VLFSEAEQKRVQGRALFVAERPEELVLGLARKRSQLPERSLPLWSEADEVPTPVIGISTALNQLLLLELVEQAYQLATVVAQRVGDRTLRLERALAEHEEDRVVIRVKPRRLVCLQRSLLGREAEAFQQEGGRREEFFRKLDIRRRGRCRETRGAHGGKVSAAKRCDAV